MYRQVAEAKQIEFVFAATNRQHVYAKQRGVKYFFAPLTTRSPFITSMFKEVSALNCLDPSSIAFTWMSIA